MGTPRVDCNRLNVVTKAAFASTCTETHAGTETHSGTQTISGTVSDSSTRALTGATTIGTGGSLAFSGTGYMDPLVHHRNRVVFFDDFLGDLIDDAWGVQADTGGSALTGTAPGTSGILTLTTDGTDDDTVMAAHDLNWKCSQGPIVMEARFKYDVITTLAFFIGLTDARTETSPNLPIGRQTTVTANTATDAVGFVFDCDSTSDVIFGSGVKAGTLIADQGASAALTAATYITLRLEVSAAGAASFYVNGTQIGATTADAVTTTVALCPYIGHANRGGFAHVGSFDYVYVSGARV